MAPFCPEWAFFHDKSIPHSAPSLGTCLAIKNCWTKLCTYVKEKKNQQKQTTKEKCEERGDNLNNEVDFFT